MLTKMINCWEIIECEESENCMAHRYPDVPCWKIDSMSGSDHDIPDVCKECKVYLLNVNDPSLKKEEIQDIMQHREIMKFVKKCPAYSNRLHNEDGMPV